MNDAIGGPAAGQENPTDEVESPVRPIFDVQQFTIHRDTLSTRSEIIDSFEDNHGDHPLTGRVEDSAEDKILTASKHLALLPTAVVDNGSTSVSQPSMVAQVDSFSSKSAVDVGTIVPSCSESLLLCDSTAGAVSSPSETNSESSISQPEKHDIAALLEQTELDRPESFQPAKFFVVWNEPEETDPQPHNTAPQTSFDERQSQHQNKTSSQSRNHTRSQSAASMRAASVLQAPIFPVPYDQSTHHSKARIGNERLCESRQRIRYVPRPRRNGRPRPQTSNGIRTRSTQRYAQRSRSNCKSSRSRQSSFAESGRTRVSIVQNTTSSIASDVAYSSDSSDHELAAVGTSMSSSKSASVSNTQKKQAQYRSRTQYNKKKSNANAVQSRSKRRPATSRARRPRDSKRISRTLRTQQSSVQSGRQHSPQVAVREQSRSKIIRRPNTAPHTRRKHRRRLREPASPSYSTSRAPVHIPARKADPYTGREIRVRHCCENMLQAHAAYEAVGEPVQNNTDAQHACVQHAVTGSAHIPSALFGKSGYPRMVNQGSVFGERTTIGESPGPGQYNPLPPQAAQQMRELRAAAQAGSRTSRLISAKGSRQHASGPSQLSGRPTPGPAHYDVLTGLAVTGTSLIAASSAVSATGLPIASSGGNGTMSSNTPRFESYSTDTRRAVRAKHSAPSATAAARAIRQYRTQERQARKGDAKAHEELLKHKQKLAILALSAEKHPVDAVTNQTLPPGAAIPISNGGLEAEPNSSHERANGSSVATSAPSIRRTETTQAHITQEKHISSINRQVHDIVSAVSASELVSTNRDNSVTAAIAANAMAAAAAEPSRPLPPRRRSFFSSTYQSSKEDKLQQFERRMRMQLQQDRIIGKKQEKWLKVLAVTSRIQCMVDRLQEHRVREFIRIKRNWASRVIQRRVRKWLLSNAEAKMHEAARVITRAAIRYCQRRAARKKREAAHLILQYLQDRKMQIARVSSPLAIFGYRIRRIQRWWRKYHIFSRAQRNVLLGQLQRAVDGVTLVFRHMQAWEQFRKKQKSCMNAMKVTSHNRVDSSAVSLTAPSCSSHTQPNSNPSAPIIVDLKCDSVWEDTVDAAGDDFVLPLYDRPLRGMPGQLIQGPFSVLPENAFNELQLHIADTRTPYMDKSLLERAALDAYFARKRDYIHRMELYLVEQRSRKNNVRQPGQHNNMMNSAAAQSQSADQYGRSRSNSSSSVVNISNVTVTLKDESVAALSESTAAGGGTVAGSKSKPPAIDLRLSISQCSEVVLQLISANTSLTIPERIRLRSALHQLRATIDKHGFNRFPELELVRETLHGRRLSQSAIASVPPSRPSYLNE
jgi:hypothetical protein